MLAGNFSFFDPPTCGWTTDGRFDLFFGFLDIIVGNTTNNLHVDAATEEYGVPRGI